MSIIQGTSKSSAATYEIDQSIRFNDNDTAYLDNTNYSGSPTSGTDCTFSFWVKRCNLSTTQCLFFGGDPNGSTWEIIRFESDDQFRVGQASSAYDLTTTQVFRDVGAWSHFVVAFDTDNGTAADRIKIYHNGSRITDFSLETNPSSGYVTNFNTGGSGEFIRIGYQGGGSNPSDVYLAEINFVDGQALAPTDFGKTNSDTGQWVPVKYTGSYGTNGFRLQGSDSSDLGEDTSGNGNDFTSSGLAAADQMSDSPTDNHCTLNPLWVDGYTLSDGNLVTNQSGDAAAIGTMAFDPTDSDGFYFEAKVTTAATYPNVGIRTIESCSKVGAVSNLSGNSTGRYSYTGSNGQFNDAGSGSSYGDAWSGTADKVIGVLVKAGSLYFSVDGTIQNSGTAAKTGLTGLMVPTVFYDAGSGTQAAWEMRFDASDWSTTPSGYKALSTANIDDPTIADPSAYFQPTTYTGDGSSSNEINQTGNSTFEPSMVWIKSRSAATDHVIQDQVRGNFIFYPNQNSAEGATGGGWVSSFDSDGFTVNVNGPVNDSGKTFVGWQWKAAGSGSSNTDGATSSTVSADTTSGFSIVTWTGTASNTTVGHGLGVAPQMIIIKNRADVDSWVVYHEDIGATKGLTLDGTAAATTASTFFNDTAPTSSVFTVGTGGRTNGSSDGMIAYCFAEVEGFSKIGSYTGNGSTNGPFIYTGFKPAFVIFKSSSNSPTGWGAIDNTRSPSNPVDDLLQPNFSSVESTSDNWDFLSNGFKVRTTWAAANGSGYTVTYMAFAESPFKTATAR